MNGCNNLDDSCRIEREKYQKMNQNECSCFFEYNISDDRLNFSESRVFPELSGKVIEHFSFQASRIIADDDVCDFVNFLHYRKDYVCEFQIKGDMQNKIWCDAKGCTIYDQDNNPVSFIGYIKNIDNQKQKEILMMEKLRKDQATGTYSESALKEKISYILRKSDLEDTYLVTILEIRRFDNLTEQLGEVFGDVVLMNIASKLKDFVCVDNINMVGRISTDKFLMFWKKPDNSTLESDSERISAIIENTYTGEGNLEQLLYSAGSAVFPKDGLSYEELFRKADIALFYTKKSRKENWTYFDYKEMPNLQIGNTFYNKYYFPDTNAYKMNDIDMELVNFTLDLLGESKDVGSAVNVLLDKIGNTFGANDVIVVEEERKSKKVSTNYLWNREEGIGYERFEPKFQFKLFELLQNKEVYDEICCISTTDALQQTFDSLEEFAELNIQKMLLCGYYDNERLKGCIFMDANGESGGWKQHEIDSFVFITKIVAFYLLKLRESERISEKMHMVENYDMLTGLPTLHKFKKDAKIIYDSNPECKFAIGYLDVNNFKYINDTKGYDSGDKLLKELALFLTDNSVPMQVNARASADNFVTFIPFQEQERLKEKIVDVVNRFLEEQKVKNQTYNISIAIGLYVMKPEETDFMSVIDNANTARKLVKNSSISICEIYDEKMEREIMKERMILGSMERALENHEFKVYLQPKISLNSGCISGAEALVRWIREDGTILPPNDFIPLFEKNGFVIQLDFYIYEEVCKLLNIWRNEKMPIVPISVNVSRVHLYHADFINKVMELINKYQIEPWMIEFELTESIFLDNTVIAITVMKELRNLGFCVSIDDFGAGYSSLNLLKDMRTDVLKLDKEFFREGDMKQEEQIIVSSIISMAKQLNMKVLSEGVETKKQSDFLKTVDCDMAQGYLYAKPLPVLEFEKLLIANKK